METEKITIKIGQENMRMLFLCSFKTRDLNDPLSSKHNWL